MMRQPAFVALEKLYPAHAAYITETKRDDYRTLARDLQRMEATIIIDGVCGHLMEHHPDTPVLSIHDEIIAPQDMSNLVHQLLISEFGKYGLTPKVAIENLSPV